ncbi:MAG: rod shape-determining protein MreC [Candidatus Komeilibacteria bacterium CG_4_10_14_0_2_um_filter_37_10]|uniref:Cell shape-determining protein MreC n=1 Tax=Candidatus Komeilibacteria bacterium CG_4_10_14_0_2_um_filter_37_10 TaxID=1974470 RepID=A0A2M7VG49_9BACT|nr:MAG: rod shape-determining protein MreC [Candidatus Komeilibacteria bacterium CG_4_10_14_0_2_um_filter_37_10]
MLGKKTYKISLLIICLIGVLIFAITDLWQPIRNAINFFLMPAQGYLFNVGQRTYATFNNIFAQDNLLKTNEVLSQQLLSCSIDQVKLLELRKENDFLRKQLNYKNENNSQLIIARVIGKQLFQSDLLMIDKGLSDGLAIGQAVVIDNGVLIGKILQMDEKRAIVALLSNHQSVVAAVIGNVHETQGLLRGNLGLGLIMDMIPASDVIAVNDLIYSSGLEERIKHRYIIGKIGSIINNQNDLYQKAEIIPAVDYKKIQNVSIVIE